MQHRDLKKAGKFALAGAICEGILALMVFVLVAGMKEDYRYYFSEEYQDGVMLLNVLGWIMVIGSIAGFVQAFINLSADEKNNTDENLIICVDCNQMISRNASQCPHCGSLMNRKTFLQNQAAPQNGGLPAWKRVELEKEALRQNPMQNGSPQSDNLPAWKRVELEKEALQHKNAAQNTVVHITGEEKCIFCGHPMSEGQLICGHCGRRQD